MTTTANAYVSRWAIVPEFAEHHEQYDNVVSLDYHGNGGVMRYPLSRSCLWFVAWESIRRAEYSCLLGRSGPNHDAVVLERILDHVERNVTSWEVRRGYNALLIYIHALGARPAKPWPQWITVHRELGHPSRQSVERAMREMRA